MADRFEIIVDTSEKKQFLFPNHKVRRQKLATGDYSITGCEDLITVERKGAMELYGMVNSARFKRELVRMQSISRKAIVVEGGIDDVLCGNRYSDLAPERVVKATLMWQIVYGVPVCWAGSRENAQAWTLRFLETWWKWRGLL